MKSSAEYLAIKLNSSYGNLEDIDHILAVVVAGHWSNFGGSGWRTFVQFGGSGCRTFD